MRIMLPTTTHTRDTITASAAALHPNITPAVIILTPYAPSSAAALLDSAHAAAHFALRARHEKSGLEFLNQLDRAQPLDRQRENLPDIAARAALAQRAHDQHRAAADLLQSIADRITTPAAQAAAAAKAAAAERAAAARELAHVQELERVISDNSHTDREDIAQAAALELWTTGNFALACRAAGQQISSIAAANGLDAARTDVTPIPDTDLPTLYAQYAQRTHDTVTPWPALDALQAAHVLYAALPIADQRAALLDTIAASYHNGQIPHIGRKGTQDGYLTIDYRDTKRYPDGLYLVHHRKTVRAVIHYDAYTDPDRAPEIVDNGGITVITNQASGDSIDELVTRANLTDRERAFLRALLDDTAARAGIRAVAAHQRKTAARIAGARDRKSARQIQREADNQTDNIRFAAMLDSAYGRDSVGIYSDTNRRKFLSRLRAKLEMARRAPDEPTPAERAERERRMWTTLHSNRSHTSTSATSPAPDMLTWTDNQTAAPAPVIQWTRRPYAQDVRTVSEDEQQRAELERQQRQRDHAAQIAYMEYRRALRDHEPTRSAYAALDAMTAAFAFVDAWTDTDIQAWYDATQVEQQRAARMRAAMRGTGICSLNSTLEQWRAWTPAERAAHMAYLHTYDR